MLAIIRAYNLSISSFKYFKNIGRIEDFQT
jgi:hypothetical protein